MAPLLVSGGAWEARAVEIRIEGSDLPGRSCSGDPTFPGYDNIHVAVQGRRPDELLGMVPGDAASAVWSLDCDFVTTPTGADFKSRHVQGRPGARFVYLSWGTVDGDGGFTMFRRAKLWLDSVDPSVLDAARRSGRLVGRLGLTDAKGQPRCAGVRPPTIEWSAR
jgi:hypothetical protein